MWSPIVTSLALATLIGMATGYSGKVLLVSFDGFRWDYLNTIPGLVNFERLAREGVRVPYMNNTFSTVTFPNHYSIATGLYQETHGIVLNTMYDPTTDAWFTRSTAADEAIPWWDGGEPVWITAVRQGLRSAVATWAGGNALIRGLRPTYSIPYNKSYSWTDHVEAAMTWFTEDNVDLVVLYNNEPDNAGHWYGPYSKETNDSVIKTDQNLGLLLNALDENNLSEDVNIIVLSDHGMAAVDISRVIDVHDYISASDYEVLIAQDSICMLLPKEGKKQAIYEGLHERHPNMSAWYKEDLPERWHYKNNVRVLPIVITMDEGWQCVENKSDPWYKTAGGDHGYDNALMSMKPIFLARGPDLRGGNYMGTTIWNLDVYPMICELLDIEPSPNNGSLNRVAQFFEGGLYQESHGMVQNRMYDPEFDDWFSMGNSETRWWEGGEPVWITAVKEGKRSGAYHWAGSEAEVQGLRPTLYTQYDEDILWEERVDTTLTWFMEENVDVGLLYYHEPDSSGHDFGTDNEAIAEVVRVVDRYLGYLLDRIDENGLGDQINVIITSDHGMSNVTFEQVLDIYDYIAPSDADIMVDEECVCMLQPADGRTDAVIDALTDAHPSLHVYRKEDLPARLHYTENRRILPVVVIMDIGWQCVANISAKPWLRLSNGNHGWDNDNPDMKPIFLARGPDFKENHMGEPLRNIDIYPLICELLDIEGAPNNGSLANTLDLLRAPQQLHMIDFSISAGVDGAMYFSGVTVLILVVLGLIAA